MICQTFGPAKQLLYAAIMFCQCNQLSISQLANDGSSVHLGNRGFTCSTSKRSVHCWSTTGSRLGLCDSKHCPGSKEHRMHRRNAAAAAAPVHCQPNGAWSSEYRAPSTLLQGTYHKMMQRYYERTPTAVTLMALLQGLETGESSPIFHDHIAFRTFGVDGFGIDSVAQIFMDFGYERRDKLDFPAKKLDAFWFAPPSSHQEEWPRVFISELKVFISELKVSEVSPEVQEVIRHYTMQADPAAAKYAALCAVTGLLPWPAPAVEDFELLAQESEYAAWVLIHGYAVNHTTVSVHRLKGLTGGIKALNAELQKRGFRLNDSGGVLKVSPDGMLLQSATVADQVPFTFSNGETRDLPASYIEFAERLVLPQYRDVPAEQVGERHRREGFEASNADSIFESTRLCAPAEDPPAAGFGYFDEGTER